MSRYDCELRSVGEYIYIYRGGDIEANFVGGKLDGAILSSFDRNPMYTIKCPNTGYRDDSRANTHRVPYQGQPK